MATKQNTTTLTDNQDETFGIADIQTALFDLTSMIRVARDSAYLFANNFAEEGERPLIEVIDDISNTLKAIAEKADKILDVVEQMGDRETL